MDKSATATKTTTVVLKYNNIKSNVDLANGLINVMAMVCFIACLSIVLYDFKQDLVVPSLLGYLIPMFVINVAVPFKIIQSKPEVRNHIKAHMKYF